MLHFIAPSVEALNVWRELLDKFRDVRSGGGSVVVKELEGPGAEEAHIDPDCGDVTEHRTVKVDEVHKLCARLGMGMKKEEIDAAFKVSSVSLLLDLSYLSFSYALVCFPGSGFSKRHPRLFSFPKLCQTSEKKS